MVFDCDFRDGTPARAAEGFAACETDSASQVARAGLPLLQRLADDLGDVAISIVLTDADTNILGSFWGRELCVDSLTDVSWVEAPIDDPRRDTPVGTIRVTCPIAEADPLVLAYAQLAARTISERIVDGAAVADRTLLERFLRARRRARGPILAVNERELLTNAAAAPLVRDGDHDLLWSWVTSTSPMQKRSSRELRLGDVMVTARCEPVQVGGELIGALVYLDDVPRASTTGTATPTPRPSLGWGSLRASELGIAEFVAAGFTNREIAARLFVSRHTVDFHLRQIYRKLSITSRVELTRLVFERTATVTD
jgi:DNA-binding CsgD family transcriptional regulator